MIKVDLQMFGSSGRIVALNERNSERSVESVTDNYGRTYPVVEMSEVADGYEIWSSGTWRGANDDFNNGYVVFAPMNGYNVDTDNGVVVKVSGEDADAIKATGGWKANPTSAFFDAYVKKYDKPGASNLVKNRVARAKRASVALKKLGL